MHAFPDQSLGIADMLDRESRRRVFASRRSEADDLALGVAISEGRWPAGPSARRHTSLEGRAATIWNIKSLMRADTHFGNALGCAIGVEIRASNENKRGKR
jgi:hypothetical protein